MRESGIMSIVLVSSFEIVYIRNGESVVEEREYWKERLSYIAEGLSVK